MRNVVSVVRTIMAYIVLSTVTPWYVFRFIFIELTGGTDPGGRLARRSINVWGRAMCSAAGTKVIAHGMDKMSPDPRVIVANHVSWFDVLTLSSVLPRLSYIAKGEMERIPLFGRAMRRAGHLFVDRHNHKAAFSVYDDAARRIRAGATVVIFPEGTRGTTYAIRPFKKGPFVLAIAAGVPIVPVLIHGTIEVLPRGRMWVQKHDVQIHALEEIPTAGMTYDDRDKLAHLVHDALAEAQKRLYGIESPAWASMRTASATPIASE
jgi:1-acyl-sn-glycerol-3-phosphate acyltransferase